MFPKTKDNWTIKSLLLAASSAVCTQNVKCAMLPDFITHLQFAARAEVNVLLLQLLTDLNLHIFLWSPQLDSSHGQTNITYPLSGDSSTRR